MGNSLLIEKLDRSNYGSWAYKMHQYLLDTGIRAISKEQMKYHQNLCITKMKECKLQASMRRFLGVGAFYHN
mgnify:FL=1